jgi:hypothetical protein
MAQGAKMRETDRCIVTPSAGPVRPSPFKSSAADMDKPEWGMQIAIACYMDPI